MSEKRWWWEFVDGEHRMLGFEHSWDENMRVFARLKDRRPKSKEVWGTLCDFRLGEDAKEINVVTAEIWDEFESINDAKALAVEMLKNQIDGIIDDAKDFQSLFREDD